MARHLSFRLLLFYAISLAFIALNLWFTLRKESFIVNLLPFFLAFVLLAVFSVDRLLMLVVFFTPLSLPLTYLYPSLPVDMFLPTEPLLFGVLLIFLCSLASMGGFNKAILRHPVTQVIFIYLLWTFITSLTSTMPLVSFKFLLVKIWFIVGFYFLGIKLFGERENYGKFVWLYVIPLLIVIGFTLIRFTGYGLLNKQAAHFVMNPFYKDHTSYGAVLAMFIPFMALFSFNSFLPSLYKWISRLVLGILVFALIFSYARAAWVSLFVAFGVWILIRLKVRFKYLLITTIPLLFLLLVFHRQVGSYLEGNNEQSSSNLVEHLHSISNITSDASNLERMNRWSCAVRMFRDRPLFGFGPGTYMFKYAPYQLFKERTIISTNAGDLGNAHSEYLGPLAESGLPGMLIFIFLISTVMVQGIKCYSRLKNPEMKSWLLGALIGLVSYYVHGFMNNFLDTDKASVPFWGFTAMIVALEISTREKTCKN